MLLELVGVVPSVCVVAEQEVFGQVARTRISVPLSHNEYKVVRQLQRISSDPVSNTRDHFQSSREVTYLQPAAAETSSRGYSPNLILLGRGWCCFVRHRGLVGLVRTPSRITEHGHVSGLAIVHDESLIMAGGRVGRGVPFGHDNNI